ncbi:YhgE/Pip family protein [Bacillus sp. CGMCC 1.60114]|uniref:YhgE/Pip family protein n=1 Tax=unclassified Bacillus (in: firmicutes) TaxID=185979 RepID=UPI003631B576
MRGFKLLGKEFATIIKSKKILIPIIAVLFIPVLYAGMFLWAFWDPYGQLKDLPVAVVNLDEGAVYNGKPIEAGKELVNNLKENKSFKWEFVSDKKAKEGMDDRKYYMTIGIPKDFSKNTTTLLDENPKKSKLEYIPNESLNFLSSQIGGSAIEKIKGEVANSVTKTYAETMFDSLKDVSKGFADASEGAGKLHDGTSQLKDGSQQITVGLGDLSKKANDGLNQLSDGSGQLTGGLGQLVDSKGKFQNGLNQLSDGSGQLTGGLGQLVDSKGKFQSGLSQLASGSNEITNGLSELNSKVSSMPDGVNQLLGGSQKITNGLKSAQKGAQDISSGASGLSQGVSEWKKQADTLSNVAQQTAGGAQQVSKSLADLNEQIKNLPEEYRKQLQPAVQGIMEGSQQVSKGTAGVAQGVQGLAGEKGAGKIEAGAKQLASGAGQLNDGISQLADGSGKVTGGLNELASQSGQLTSGVSALLDGSQKITGGLNQFVDPKGELQTNLGKLLSGSQQITGGLNQFVDPKGELQTNLGKLLSGSQKITGGLGQFVDPKGDFQSGLTRLQDGSDQVTSGLGEANDGSKELATKLGEGAEKTSETKGTNKTYDMFSSPVKVKTEKVAEVPNYGTGFTPYFLSLGLFVGALLLSIVFPLRETVGIPKSGFSWFISKFGVLLVVGVIQALIADAILLLGLGVEVQSVPYFVLFSIITSLSFIALVQFLVTAFSDAGRFVAILTLILQLTTSAGTFPLELIPKPLQVFNAWFPMTYSVSGFKAVISSGDYSFMWHNAGILIGFIVLLSLGTIGTLTWMHKRQFGKFAEAE